MRLSSHRYNIFLFVSSKSRGRGQGKTPTSTPESMVDKSTSTQIRVRPFQIDKGGRSLSGPIPQSFGHHRHHTGSPPKPGKTPVSAPESMVSGPTFEEWFPAVDTDTPQALSAMIVNSSERRSTGFDLREVMVLELETVMCGDQHTTVTFGEVLKKIHDMGTRRYVLSTTYVSPQQPRKNGLKIEKNHEILQMWSSALVT